MKRALASVLAAAVAVPPAWGRAVAPRARTGAPATPAVPAPFLIKPGMSAPAFSPYFSGSSLSAGLAPRLPSAAAPAQVLAPPPAAAVRHVSQAQRLVIHNAGARRFFLYWIAGMRDGEPVWGPGAAPVEPGHEGAADFRVRTWEEDGGVTSLLEPFLRAAYVGLSATDALVGLRWEGEEFVHIVRFSLSSSWSEVPAPAGEHRLAPASPDDLPDGVTYAELAPVGMTPESVPETADQAVRAIRRPGLSSAVAAPRAAAAGDGLPSPSNRTARAVRGTFLAARLAVVGAAFAGLPGVLAQPLVHATAWSAVGGVLAGAWTLHRLAKLAGAGLGDSWREKVFSLAVLAGAPLAAGAAAYFGVRELLATASFSFYGGNYPILGLTALPGLAFLTLESARSRGVFKNWRPLAALSAAGAGLTALAAAGLAYFVGGWAGALGAAALSASAAAWAAFISDPVSARGLPDPMDRTTYMMLADASFWNSLAVAAAVSLASAGWVWAAAAPVLISAWALAITALAVPDESARAAARRPPRKSGILQQRFRLPFP